MVLNFQQNVDWKSEITGKKTNEKLEEKSGKITEAAKDKVENVWYHFIARV